MSGRLYARAEAVCAPTTAGSCPFQRVSLGRIEHRLGGERRLHNAIAQRALAAASQLGLPVPSAGPVTRAEAVEAVDAVAGLSPQTPASPTYTDVPSSSSAYGAIEAALAAGLTSGWAPASGAFQPDAPMSRIDLAVLATSALGLDGKAAALISNVSLYPRLGDLTRAGYDLGFANAMLEEGVVPPVSASRYMPEAPVTPTALAVALYRMWLVEDVPAAATLTPQAPKVLTGASDALTLTVQNRLGAPVPGLNLARYHVAYTAAGATVSGGVFSAATQGKYAVTVSLSGPLLPQPLTATASVSVTTPPPPPLTAPSGVGASEVSGGVRVSWTAGENATAYQILKQVNGSGAFSPVSGADGGTPAAGSTSATVTGLTAGDTYAFEVEALGYGGTQSTSAASSSAPYGASGSAALVGPTAATGTITLAPPLVTSPTAATISLVFVCEGGCNPGATIDVLNGSGSVIASATPSGAGPTLMGSLAIILNGVGGLTATWDEIYTVTVYAPAGSAGNSYTATSSLPSVIAVQGTGTGSAYFSGGQDADTVSVNGQTFSALDTAPQYNDASSLATVIRDTAATAATAKASGDTVTVTALTPGFAGNALTLATNNPTDTTLSGATLTGGSNGTLTLTFSQAMDESTITTANLSTVLTPSSGHTFGGSGLAANWLSSTELQIDLGSGATVASGDTIAVANTVTDGAGNPVASTISVP